MSWAAVLAIGVVLASEGAARADEPPALRLEYRAPVSCPDEAALVSRIRARVDMRLARLGETVPTFDVTVQTDGGRVVGRIASMSERGEPTWREVSGSDCSDVVDAVALIVAMALSPETSGNAPAHAGAGAGANASAGATAGSFAPSTTGATTDVTVASGNPPASPARETPTVNSESKPRIKLLGSGQAEVTLGYWPSALVAAGARLQVFRTRAYASGPSMAIGFAAAQPVDRDLSMGQSMAHAHLALTTGELFVCPWSLDLAPSLSLRPCARLDIGQLKAQGSGIAGARGEDLLFSSAGALGQISFVPVKPLVIDAQASVLFPLTPYEFTFIPDSVIYHAPIVGFSASLAVGVMFF